MSLSEETSAGVGPYCYEDEILTQHLLQPDASYWLTTESPIAAAVSVGQTVPDRTPSIDYTTFSAATAGQSRTTENGFSTNSVENVLQSIQNSNPMSHLHLSELETSYVDIPSGLPWTHIDEHMIFNHEYALSRTQPPPVYTNSNVLGALNPHHVTRPSSPYSTPSIYDDSPLQSPYLSSPELYSPMCVTRAPRSSPADDYNVDEEEDDATDGKPYARLIYEALFQAPGHRMMLRDIYEWFEINTNKPRESGSNGWQNSIRHNLSMNKAFENDKTHCTNARGEPKKATSVWSLTQDALRNGVQSTTRYRKTGGVKKAGIGGSPDYRRQRSGAKGGRAARRAARLRRLEQSYPHWMPNTTPGDAGRFNNLEHTVSYLNDYSSHYDSSPPTPSENFPYTPRSPGHRTDCVLDIANQEETEGRWMNANGLSTQDFLCQPQFGTVFDYS